MSQRKKVEYGARGRRFQLWNNQGSDYFAVESPSSLLGISVYLWQNGYTLLIYCVINDE
jgi:hypothetical protein